MISLQKIFGRDQKFFDLLEGSAQQSHASAILLKKLVEGLRSPEAGTQSLDEFASNRYKDKQITQQISEALCRTFITPLDREDIEALSATLYKIPKRVSQIGERLVLYREALPGLGEEFQRQIVILEEATSVVESMVGVLRHGSDVEKTRTMNDKLQALEGEADKLVLRMLQGLYQGHREPRDVIIFKDIFELLEKAIDRCRDAGNTVFHIVLKNS